MTELDLPPFTVTDAVPGSGSRAVLVPGSLVPAPGSQIAIRQQAELPELSLDAARSRAGTATAAVRYWIGLAADGFDQHRDARPNGIIAGLWSASGLEAHTEYVRSRAWLPDGHEGWLLPAAYYAYQLFIGYPGVITGQTIKGLAERPMRLLIALTVAGAAWLIIATSS